MSYTTIFKMSNSPDSSGNPFTGFFAGKRLKRIAGKALKKKGIINN